MKFFKVLSLALCALLALQTAQLQAVLIGGFALKNTMHSDKNNMTLAFGEAHVMHCDNPKQLYCMNELISQYGPEDICLIVEAPTVCGFDRVTASIYEGDRSILIRLAALAESKKVEVHRVDWRKTINRDKKPISIHRSPEQVTVVEFLALLDEQLEKIQTVDPKILNIQQKQIIAELKKLCRSSEFSHKLLNDVFQYCKQLKRAELLHYCNIHDLMIDIVDARIIAHACSTKKKYVFIAAGLLHVEQVVKLLEKRRYQPIAEQYSMNKEKLIQLRQQYNFDDYNCSAIMPALDIQQFEQHVSSALMSAQSSTASEPFESKTDSSLSTHQESQSSSSTSSSSSLSGACKKLTF
jgi:hypothetical protein